MTQVRNSLHPKSVPDTLIEKPKNSIKVLHIEDDGDFAEIVSAFLEQENEDFDITIETDPREGLRSVEENGFDCLVCDYEMPGMDGIEVLKKVRKVFPEIPFILFTGKGSEEVASEAISEGVTDYLRKSGSKGQYAVLANRIKNSVEGYRAEKQVKFAFKAFENAYGGIAFLTDDGEFLYVNEAFADLLGYERDDIIGGGWEHLYRDEDVQEIHEKVLPLARDGGWSGETVYLRKDEEKVTLDHRLAYTEDGVYICTVSEI